MRLSLLSCVLHTTQGCPAQLPMCAVLVGTAAVVFDVYVKAVVYQV